MQVWETPTHRCIHEDGTLDIIEKATGQTLQLKVTLAKARQNMRQPHRQLNIDVFLKVFPQRVLMYKPEKVAMTTTSDREVPRVLSSQSQGMEMSYQRRHS